MSKILFIAVCFALYISNVVTFSIVVRRRQPIIHGGPNLFEDIFRTIRHIIEDSPTTSTTSSSKRSFMHRTSLNHLGDFRSTIDDTDEPKTPILPALSTPTAKPRTLISGDPQNIFETKKIVELPEGGEKIEKLVEKEYFDDDFTKKNVDREMTELYRFPNHTLRMVRKDGTNLTLKEDRKIDCIEHRDCNLTSYCTKDSYTCHSCHAELTPCTENFQCCPGHMCDPFQQICIRNKEKPGSCSFSSDCEEGNCCAINDDGEAVCQPFLKEGEDCSRDPFEFLFGLHHNRLPNKCACAPGLACKKTSTFPFLISETCERIKKSSQKSLKKRPHPKARHLGNNWHFHGDDEDDFPSLPIPDFDDIGSSFSALMNDEKSGADSKKNSSNNEKINLDNPHIKKKPEKKEAEQKMTVFDDKIRFSPLSNISPVGFHQHINEGNGMSTISRNDDSDEEEDFIGHEFINKNDMLDFINDDNEKGDEDRDIKSYRNDGNEKEFVDESDVGKKHDKREVVEKINEKAREATHKVVDGIFDKIMKGVIKSMKYQA